MGEVEDELARIRRITRARNRAESSAQGKVEAANSKTLTSSIAQMTIGTVSPVTTTSMARQATATFTSSSAAAARGQPSTQAGPTDATPPATQPATQLTTGSPYATPLPPPGFLYLPAGYPPYWGMYPQYVPPMTALSLGGTVAVVNTTSLASGMEQCSPSAPVEPAPDAPEMRPEPPQSPGEDLGWLADIYDDMPPLEEPEDSDEGSEIEVQGTVCAVALVQKGRGCH